MRNDHYDHPSETTGLLRPLLEQLCDGFLDHLLILITVVVPGVLSDSTPDQTLIFRVVKIHDHRSHNILFRSDAAHTATDSAHAQRAVGGMLLHPAIGSDEQIGILTFLNLLKHT
jgi:hypothetical protein